MLDFAKRLSRRRGDSGVSLTFLTLPGQRASPFIGIAEEVLEKPGASATHNRRSLPT